MADYSRQIANADRIIRDKGALVDYIRTPNVAGDDTPWFPTSGANQTFGLTPILSTNEGIARYFAFQFKPTPDTLAGTRQFIMPGNVPFVPTYRDVIRWPDGDFYVVDIDVIGPDGTPILYFLTGDDI